ncbi:MAG: AAA family ATPase [Caldilineales bacterium]|nr:AAA family ATPase [Caldilineales bacterium]
MLWDDQPVPGFEQLRLQHLLAYLVLHRDTPVSRQQLAFRFWPDTTDQQALKNLRTLLTRFRRALPHADDFVAVTSQTLQWQAAAPFTLDVVQFEAALAQAKVADREGAVDALAAAVAAYGGDLLPDCYDDWIHPQREQMRRAYGQALERLVLMLDEQRDYARAIPYAERLVHFDPLHEAAYRHLMRLHLALGNRAEALRVFQACEAMLQREFGLVPGRATRRLYERLLKMEEPPVRPLSGRFAEPRPADPPLVGRQEEWARLVAAWRAAASGRPQMVLLTGEAGIGKTRLAETFLDWVSAQGFPTAAAHGYPTNNALVYAPVAEWLHDPVFQPRLAALDDPRLCEVARILPGLLAQRPNLAPPGPLTEAWQRTRLFEALARALLGFGADKGEPLLLFLDDLQWADRETLDWLVYLLRFDPHAPLLLLGTVREHEMTADHPLNTVRLALTRAGLLSVIALSPLGAAETAALAASVAGRPLETEEANRIYRETEGNPLYVVEMVRAGLDRGRTEEDEETRSQGRERGYPVPPTASLALPPKVRAVIEWRLAMLSPTAQELAQVGAVIGRRFSFDVLARASAQDEMALVEGLDELWQRRIVRGEGTDTYNFSHEWIRAVAYETMGPIRRRAIHQRVAEVLETLHANDLDTVSGQIAVHYERAGLVQPAIAYYRRAAAAAQRVYAHAEAVRLYTHLLHGELSAGLSAGERCAIMLALAEIWRMTGYWASALNTGREALTIAETVGDAHLLAQAQCAVAEALYLQGYYDAALDWLARAEQGFMASGDRRGVVIALGTMGQIHWLRGNHSRALAVLARQLQIATEVGDPHGIGEALEAIGMVHWSQGDWERAADCCLEATRIVEPLGDKQVLARAAITLGNVRAAQHRTDEAVSWYLRAGKLAQQMDDRRTLSRVISNIARILARRGEYARAIAGYQRSLRNAWEIGDRATACLNLAGLAAVHERVGNTHEAEFLYRKAIGFGLRLGMPAYLAGMFVGMARLLLACGRAAEARDFYGEALDTIANVSGERLAGEDTRFEARVLGIRLRHALGQRSPAETLADLRALLPHAAPHQQATLHYELWRLAPEDETARRAAAAFYRSDYAETGEETSRLRYQALVGETLPDPPPLPDVSELIPDTPEGLDLASLLADLEASFEKVL